MTHLSINLNKIALLRNSRGRDFPNVVDFAKKFIDLGVHGITVHPRPDERHIKFNDVHALKELLIDYPKVELNIEGYPSKSFLKLIEDSQPDQCTLVPDDDNQLTSDHGWALTEQGDALKNIFSRLKNSGTRTAAFLDPDISQIKATQNFAIDRIELYTESFAASHGTSEGEKIFQLFSNAAAVAQKLNLGVNAGHDLDLRNLPKFLEIDGILEVSIGHALTVECIEFGIEKVIRKYLELCI